MVVRCLAWVCPQPYSCSWFQLLLRRQWPTWLAWLQPHQLNLQWQLGLSFVFLMVCSWRGRFGGASLGRCIELGSSVWLGSWVGELCSHTRRRWHHFQLIFARIFSRSRLGQQQLYLVYRQQQPTFFYCGVDLVVLGPSTSILYQHSRSRKLELVRSYGLQRNILARLNAFSTRWNSRIRTIHSLVA